MVSISLKLKEFIEANTITVTALLLASKAFEFSLYV